MDFLALVLALVAVAMARKSSKRIASLEAELATLAGTVRGVDLRVATPEQPAAVSEPTVVAEEPLPSTVEADVVQVDTDLRQASPWTSTSAEAGSEPAPVLVEAAEAADTVTAEVTDGGRGWNFEELFGRRLPVWGGGIALALAGFFLVKYSVEIGLVTPAVRIFLGLLFGLGLIGSAEAARRMPRLAADPRVAQALSGAGVATLYGVAYMATNLYGLISPVAGFVSMAAVTAAALLLSLRFGAPTAVLGLIGGFATPALVNTGENNVPALLGYLLLTIGGMLGVARTQGWRWLGFLALAGGFGWSGLLLATDLIGVDVPGTGLFLILLAAGALAALGPDHDPNQHMRERITAAALPLLAAAVAFVQLAVLIGKGGFGWLEWGLYGLLAAGVTVLALREATYRLLPPAALAVALVTFALWPAPAFGDAAFVATGLLLVFALPGYLLSQRSNGGLTWAAQASAATLLTSGLLHGRMGAALGDWAWALICLGLAVPAAFASSISHRRILDPHDPRRALFLSTAAILVGAAAILVVPALYLPLVILLIAAGLAWMAREWRDAWLGLSTAAAVIASAVVLAVTMAYPIKAFVRLTVLAASTAPADGLWRFLLPAAVVAFIAWIEEGALRRHAYSIAAVVLLTTAVVQVVPLDGRPVAIAAVAALLFEAARRQDRLSLRHPAFGVAGLAVLWTAVPLAIVLEGGFAALAGNPLLTGELPTLDKTFWYLLLPTLALAAIVWREQAVARLHWAVAVVPVVLALVTVFVGYKHLFGIADVGGFRALGFAERVLLTQALFAGGAAAYAAADRHRLALPAARLLTGLALFRFVWFDIFVFNPLLQAQSVGSWPVINLLPIAYGFPVYWLMRLRAAEPGLPPAAVAAAKGLALASVVLLVGLTVRQLFHGAVLTDGGVGDGEFYAYSAAGLATAIGLLLWGTARQDQMTRLASLGLMLATVAKVFLSDAAALEGLWRIASFFGLGLSLIGISWFYTRHVFAGRRVSAG